MSKKHCQLTHSIVSRVIRNSFVTETSCKYLPSCLQTALVQEPIATYIPKPTPTAFAGVFRSSQRATSH